MTNKQKTHNVNSLNFKYSKDYKDEISTIINQKQRYKVSSGLRNLAGASRLPTQPGPYRTPRIESNMNKIYESYIVMKNIVTTINHCNRY